MCWLSLSETGIQASCWGEEGPKEFKRSIVALEGVCIEEPTFARKHTCLVCARQLVSWRERETHGKVTLE